MLAAALGCGGERSDGHEPREPGGARRQATASAPGLGLPVEAAAAMLEPPAEEPERAARLEALRQRWYRAADRGAPDEALVEMERSVWDADPEVAALAQDALDDLIALREGRPGQAAVPELGPDAEQPLSSQAARSALISGSSRTVRSIRHAPSGLCNSGRTMRAGGLLSTTARTMIASPKKPVAWISTSPPSSVSTLRCDRIWWASTISGSGGQCRGAAGTATGGSYRYPDSSTSTTPSYGLPSRRGLSSRSIQAGASTRNDGVSARAGAVVYARNRVNTAQRPFFIVPFLPQVSGSLRIIPKRAGNDPFDGGAAPRDRKPLAPSESDQIIPASGQNVSGANYQSFQNT